MARLTKRFVDTLSPPPNGREITHWDDSLKGFGLRVQASGVGSWIIMYRTYEGRLRKLTLGRVGRLTPDEARKEARQKLAYADRGGDPAGEKAAARKAMTVGELCDWYLREAGAWVKPATLKMDKSRIECHVRPLIGHRAVTKLTSGDLEKMQSDIAAGKTASLKKREGRGGRTTGGKGTAARTLAMMSTMLEMTRRNGVIKDNPARIVKKYPSKKRTRFLSFEEFTALGVALREAEMWGENSIGIAAVKALALTGCRRTEILSLPWKWLDAQNSCLRFGDTKTGAQIRPIGKSAAEFLAKQPHEENQKWIFPATSGEGYFIGLPRAFASLCKRANIEGATIHTLRHSFASAAAALGYSELTIAGLLGHSLSGITARYAHLPDKALVAAADKVSEKILEALNSEVEANIVEFPEDKKLQAGAQL